MEAKSPHCTDSATDRGSAEAAGMGLERSRLSKIHSSKAKMTGDRTLAMHSILWIE